MAIFPGLGFAPIDIKSYPVVTGTDKIEEGLALTFKLPLQDGMMKVQVGSSSSSDKFAGFAYNQYLKLPTVLPRVEEFSAISALTSQVVLSRTPNNPATEMKVVVINPATLAETILTYSASAASSTAFTIVGTLVTFDSSFDNFKAVITYNFTPTQLEARNFYGDVVPGIANTGVIGVTSVITKGTVVLSNYTTGTDWNSAAALTINSAGFVTKGGTGCTIPEAMVKQAPSQSNPYLVIELLNY